MSTTPRPAASDSLIGLIQPYVDDDLPADERARVDAVLAEDPVLREMVEEQCSVRQALRSLPPTSAPQALQARVLLELDAIDREQFALEREQLASAALTPRWSRWRSFFRGAAVMVPAGATALALFLMVRTGTHNDTPFATSANASANTSANTLGNTAARTEFRLDQAPLLFGSGNADASPGVRLVGAPLGSSDTGITGPQVPSMVELRVGSRRILDRQEPAGGPPPGPAHDHRGRRFWLGTIEGQPAVSFETEGLRHTLTRLGPGFPDEQEYMFLLSLGHAMR